MKTRSMLLIGMLLLSLEGHTRARADTGELFQSSYDSEAAGKLQEALGAIERVQKDTFVVQLRRGWLLYRLGRNDESIEAYKRAVALAPRAVEARVGILLPELALRRWADAEAQAKAALREDPNNYLAALRLAFTWYNLHRYDDSARLYTKLHDLYPSDVEVMSGLGWAQLKAGKKEEAAQTFREAQEIAPRHALVREGLKAAGG